MSKGIVVSAPTVTSGRLVVIKADENNHEVGNYKYLDYANKTGEILKVNDAVLLTITSSSGCDVDEKYAASRAKVNVEIWEQQSKDHCRITVPETDNYGFEKDDVAIFDSYPDENGQYPGPPQTQWGDTIEVMLEGDLGGVFVKVVSNP